MDLGPQFVGASPVPEIAAGAARYRKLNGFLAPEQDYRQAVIPPSRSRQIGQAYMAMPEHDPAAVPAYRQMAEETGRQFDHMTKPRSRGGMGINVSVTKDDPYGGAGPGGDYSTWSADRVIPELRHDVQANNHISVLSTKTTGGHPVFSDDENDMFRAVHDVFGHLGSGRGIDMHGEDAAYQAHAGMFSPTARRAMATETRGQNAALHLTGDFQAQKTGFLPERFQAPHNLSSLQFGEMPGARRDAANENRKQGL